MDVPSKFFKKVTEAMSHLRGLGLYRDFGMVWIEDTKMPEFKSLLFGFQMASKISAKSSDFR